MHKKLWFASYVFILTVILIAGTLLLPPAARAEAEEGRKTVRVGWYESPFNISDETGGRSGYAYEYQQRIAAYTGWRYEYVEGSWTELMDLLREGRIDLMSDISYTPERSREMLFSSMPMGIEEYYIFVSPDSKRLFTDDPETFAGMKIGVTRNSYEEELLTQWLEDNHVEAKVVETTGTDYDSLKLMNDGELDAFMTLDVYADYSKSIPVCRIGASDFYFAVSKSRPDLLDELNTAMGYIQSENSFYNHALYEKYFHVTAADLYLSAKEHTWLDDHSTIRVGYQDNYLAFCGRDENGELTGALKDYLDYAADCIRNARFHFEPIAFPSIEDALEAMKKGEVDCVFPSNLSIYNGEEMDVLITDPFITTEMYAVVRSEDQKAFLEKKEIVAAVNKGNTNYEAFLMQYYPDWGRLYCEDTEECLKAVASGKADCLIASSYRYNNLSHLIDKLKLASLSTGVDLDYSFVVRREDDALFSIMNKIANLVPPSLIDSSLTFYSAEDRKVTFSEYVQDNLAIVMTVIAAVSILILLLALRTLYNEKRVNDEKKLILAVERDELTGLYNRNFFFEYANRMQQEHPDTPMDAVIVNIEQFHHVNDLNGWDFGDQVLGELGGEINAFLAQTEGIGGRFEADRFDIFCRPEKDYPALLTRFQEKIDQVFPNSTIRLRMGVMPWQKELSPVQLFDRARTACNKVRGSKKHIMIYDEEMQKRERMDERLLNDFGRAIREREFVVYYQPKYDIQSDPPVLNSAEALIRWQHPELGMVPPGDFIPLFEGNGQICEIDKYVWRETARQMAEWRDNYGVSIAVSVNLSRVDVQDPTLEKTLDDLVEKYGLDRSSFQLEVTESAYTDDAENLNEVIHRLREKGHEIEMDDFGSGYSSLNMLSSLPVDVLKMDRAFIKNIEQSDKAMRLVKLILEIARNLHVPVVAEGVETETQMLMLKQAGCELVQGYYFSRPLPASEFSRLLEDK